jgi:hypothetical protein
MPDDQSFRDPQLHFIDDAEGGADIATMHFASGNFAPEADGLSLTVDRLSSVAICMRIILTPAWSKSIL